MYNVEKMSKHTLNVNTAKFLKYVWPFFNARLLTLQPIFYLFQCFYCRIFFFFLNVIFLILIEVAENEMG